VQAYDEIAAMLTDPSKHPLVDWEQIEEVFEGLDLSALGAARSRRVVEVSSDLTFEKIQEQMQGKANLVFPASMTKDQVRDGEDESGKTKYKDGEAHVYISLPGMQFGNGRTREFKPQEQGQGDPMAMLQQMMGGAGMGMGRSEARVSEDLPAVLDSKIANLEGELTAAQREEIRKVFMAYLAPDITTEFSDLLRGVNNVVMQLETPQTPHSRFAGNEDAEGADEEGNTAQADPLKRADHIRAGCRFAG